MNVTKSLSSLRPSRFVQRRILSLAPSLSGRGGALRISALSALLFWGAGLPARGQLTLTLPGDPLTINLTTGGTAIFQATLTNNYTFDLFLNSDSFTVSNPALLDDTLFQNYFVTPSQGAQPTLAANGGTVTLDLFRVTLPAGTSPGIYTGILTLQGGATPLDAEDLITGEFAVEAAPAVDVPETNSVAMWTGLLSLSGGMLLYRRRFPRKPALRGKMAERIRVAPGGLPDVPEARAEALQST